jgi:hypothetical protein
VLGVGATGAALVAASLAARWPQVLPWGLAGVGAAYTVYLALRPGTVDPRAPIVAAALFGAAEFAFWSLEPHVARRAERTAVLRRLALIGGSALGTALLASLVLVVAASASGGVLLEAVGVVAAVATLGVVAVLAWRLGAKSTST